MKFLFAIWIDFLLMICSLAAQPRTNPRELKVAPGVLVQLPPNFTAQPAKSAGLTEIVVQLPNKQFAYVKVTTEERGSEKEAIQRLLEVAREAEGKRSFIAICGWPALERRYQVKLGQVMAKPSKEPQPEAPLVQAATIAIAQNDLLVRFEARLQPGATAEAMAPIFAFVRTISCPDNPNSDTTKATIERLTKELTKGSTGISSPDLLSRIVRRPVSGLSKGRDSRVSAGVETSLGPTSSEIQITTSSDGKTVVLGSNGGTMFSTNYGDSFAASTVNFGFTSGDPTLATGASGRIYLSGVNLTPTGCAVPVDVDNSGTGATFNLAGNAALSPLTGSIFFPDQPQMAADARNLSPMGDQVYVVWRNFTRPFGSSVTTCNAITWGDHSPTISCSSDNGATWGHQTTVGSGDPGRITVGPDGFVYVTYMAGANVMLNKFSSCASGLVRQSGFPVTVASSSGIDCPISGIDRCTSSLESPQPAVLLDFANDVFVVYPEKSGGGNDNIVVRHSNDGGLTWPHRTIANTSVTAHRFMPWVCGAGAHVNVSWYDRRAATPADDSLTSYFFNTASGLSVGTEQNISVVADSQKTATGPVPKYGDYNGNACTRDRVYVGWASATAPQGVTIPTGSGINVFVEAIPPGPPMVTSVSPNREQCGSGATIAIAGANFRSVSSVLLKRITGTVPVSSFTVNSTSLITATVPTNLGGGVYEVVISTPSGSSTQPVLSTRTDLFSVAPTITRLTPSSGPGTGSTQVMVDGSCFQQGSGFLFGSAPAVRGYGQCASDRQCVVYSPAAIGAGSVDVVATTEGVVSLIGPADRFTYAGPQITGIHPASGPITGGTALGISGSGFPSYDGHSLANVPMSFGSVNTVAECDLTWCLVTTPPALTPGAVDVIAYAFGTSSAVSPGDMFTFTAQPSLVRFETGSSYSGVSAVVGLDGNAPGAGASVVLSSANPSLVSVPSTATIPVGQVATSVPLTINPSPISQTVILTANYLGKTLTSTVSVPPSRPLTITIGATALSAGQSTTVTIGINAPAPAGGAAVTLSSSTPATISVPVSVTIPSGSYSTNFPITNRYSGGPNLVTITGSYNGASASDSVVVFIAPPTCTPSPCPHLYYWNPTDCKCVHGLPTVAPH